MTEQEAELKALLERMRDAGTPCLAVYMPPGQGPRYAGPHVTADELDRILLAVMAGYRDALKPRAVN